MGVAQARRARQGDRGSTVTAAADALLATTEGGAPLGAIELGSGEGSPRGPAVVGEATADAGAAKAPATLAARVVEAPAALAVGAREAPGDLVTLELPGAASLAKPTTNGLHRKPFICQKIISSWRQWSLQVS